MEYAVLAGGCFWGMEELLRQLDGVLDTEVGYTGGELKNPRYDDVKLGRSGHAEAIKLVFDPQKISYAEILHFFFRIHDPTTMNRQGNDLGHQYRSAIFFVDEKQKEVATQVLEEIDRSGKWPGPIVTEITALHEFFAAEAEHQDYLAKNPGGYTCHWVRD